MNFIIFMIFGFFLMFLIEVCIDFHRFFVVYFARVRVLSGSLNQYLSGIKDHAAMYKLLQ